MQSALEAIWSEESGSSSVILTILISEKTDALGDIFSGASHASIDDYHMVDKIELSYIQFIECDFRIWGLPVFRAIRECFVWLKAWWPTTKVEIGEHVANLEYLDRRLTSNEMVRVQKKGATTVAEAAHLM